MATKTIEKRTKRRQVKVKIEFATNLFYEKVLTDWKNSIDDKNRASTVRRALDGLRTVPIEVKGITQLKLVHGIGENIASRLDAAWNLWCSEQQRDDFEAKDIKSLIKKGEALRYLTESQVSVGRVNRVPFLPKNKPTKQNSVATLSQPSTSLAMTNSTNIKYQIENQPGDDFNASFSQPLPTIREEPPLVSRTFTPTRSTNKVRNISPPRPSQLREEPMAQDAQPIRLEYEPKNFERCKVLLIVDNREGINRGRSKGLTQHLDKMGVNYELRELKVGDFLWVMKFEDGREMVMDTVIERKTWDDLKHSIRDIRYSEQKKRLKNCGAEHIVLLVEGGAAPDRGLEQALATTSIENRFMIQRTSNTQGTASFLASITKKLEVRAFTEHMVGYSFEAFQRESVKTTSITVKELWIKQLTVCPRMSVSAAKIIARRFPTFRQLVEFYRRNSLSDHPIDPAQLLSETFSDINRTQSQNLSRFFVR